MSVRSTAKRFANACRAAMPDARIHFDNSRAPWGFSSYVYIVFGTDSQFCRKVRVSDHGIGERRFNSDPTSLYLAEGARPSSWELWLAETSADYWRAGGRLPSREGLFAEAVA